MAAPLAASGASVSGKGFPTPGVGVSVQPKLSDAVYDEIADALVAEADRIGSWESSASAVPSKGPKTRRKSKAKAHARAPKAA